MMRKVVFLIFILSGLIGCSCGNDYQEKIEYCVAGCIAGTHHNDSGFYEVDLGNNESVSKLILCDKFCEDLEGMWK